MPALTTTTSSEAENQGNQPVPAAVALAAIDGSGYLQTFDGNPAAPQPWRPSDVDVTVHSRDTQTFTSLEAMDASHGADCAGPPATHRNTSYEGAVFLCKDHVMTAMNAAGYGLIYLTPPAMADWSAGESVVRWDMSTLRTSPRDWVDLWIVPYEDELQLALDEWIPDGNGLPRRAIHIRMDNGGQGGRNSIFRVELIDDYQNVGGYEGYQPGLEYELAQRGLTTSASRRDTFELRIRPGHVAFTMPQYGITFADAAVPGLTWTRGVVTLGHHSYNPGKDCSPGGTLTCQPGTWHWDSLSINPTVPFTIIRPNRRFIDAANPGPFILDRDAPANAVLRFAGIGERLEVSYDGGAWRPAVAQVHTKPDQGEIFVSYRMPVPRGTRQVAIRGQNWWGGPWRAQSLSVWAQGAAAPPGATPTWTPSPVPTPTSMPTSTSSPPSPTAPLPTGTSTTTLPTSTPTPAATATPLPASTSTPMTVPTASPAASSTPTPTGPPLDVTCRLDGNVLTCVLPN